VPAEGYHLTHGNNTYRVPAGASIAMSAWVGQYDPHIFPEPHEFRPSRWLDSAGGCGGPDGDLDRYLVAFSKGTRACGGVNLAYLEMYLALAAMVVRFRVKGEAEPGKEMVLLDQFVGLLKVCVLITFTSSN
jgi:cytochrome P450